MPPTTSDAAYVQVGDRFRIHWDGKFHTVISVTPGLDGQHTLIAFDDGSVYTFLTWGERVAFPRRADGSTCDWRTTPEPPRARELCHGDLLPNPDFPDMPLAEPQRVILVQAVAGVDHVVDVTTATQSVQGTRRWRFIADEIARWPRTPVSPETGVRAAKTGILEFAGPYTRPDLTGTEFWFAEHPTGRGRWPAGILPYDWDFPYEPGVYRLRFPRHDWDPRLVPSSSSLPIGHIRAYRRQVGGVRWN